MNLSSDDYVFWWYHYISMDCQLLRTSTGLRALNSSWTYFYLHLTSIFTCAVPDTLGTPTWHLWYVSPPLPPNPRFVNWSVFVAYGWTHEVCLYFRPGAGRTVNNFRRRNAPPLLQNRQVAAAPLYTTVSTCWYVEPICLISSHFQFFLALCVLCCYLLFLPLWCLHHRFNNNNLRGQRP